MSDKAELRIDEERIELPVVVGTEGERALDIGRLRAETGLVTLDPAYVNTGSCRSAITFIDGENGILRYRGYPIEELAERSTFLETAWLLLEGELPSKAELERFTHDVRTHTMLHEDVKCFFSAFTKTAHPMAVVAAVISALSTFYQDSIDPNDPDHVALTIRRLLAKVPTIAAYAYKHSIGQPFLYPRNDLDYASNFLHLMFATPCEDYEVDPVVAKTIDLLLLLHADHEQNCSTSTVRLVGSSDVNLFAAISAGVSALWGPLHGGANQAVIEMLEEIEREGISGREFLDRVKDKKSGRRLMGFGHRVYKNYDPRAKIIKKACDEVLRRMRRDSRLLELAVEIEEIALRDEYFVSRRLYPNVDFYSGIIYQAIGIPTNMFTVMFVLGRLPGWIAQWREMRSDPRKRIGRPRQLYVGPPKRSYVPIDERGGGS